MKNGSMEFDKNFVWGAACSAYQIEGAAEVGGRGPSVWDMFCCSSGKVWRGDTGALACDHYHRFEEDVRLMQALGLQAYRFSVSWSRVLPGGTGAVNDAGLDFYDRLVDRLLAAGVAPYCTLFHWDFPLELFHRGGWLNRASADWFAEFAALMASRLGDRVKHWLTINEPQIYIGLGHHKGTHAPGLSLPFSQVLLAAHNTLLAHGKAVQALRAERSQLRIGLASAVALKLPAQEGESAEQLAKRATFESAQQDCWTNSLWLDPILRGEYPPETALHWNPRPGHIDDLPIISQPLDFLGLNVYSGSLVEEATPGQSRWLRYPAGQPASALNWDIVPRALYYAAKWFFERYRLPILITENGISVRDSVDLNGAVQDPQRIDFTHRYLRALAEAIAEGTEVQGYFHWSLLDNFEWAEGYKDRFGLIHVDYATQQRTPKASAAWYREVIRSNGRSLFRVDERSST